MCLFISRLSREPALAVSLKARLSNSKKSRAKEKHRQRISNFNADNRGVQINHAQSRHDHHHSPRIIFSTRPCALASVPQILATAGHWPDQNLTPVVFLEDHASSAKCPAQTGGPDFGRGLLLFRGLRGRRPRRKGAFMTRIIMHAGIRVVHNIPCKALVRGKAWRSALSNRLARLGGATKAIRVMKESWDCPAGRARGSFQRVVRDFAGEGLFLCLLVIKVAGVVVAIHNVTSALAGGEFPRESATQRLGTSRPFALWAQTASDWSPCTRHKIVAPPWRRSITAQLAELTVGFE
jgi:hypothetical protein